MKKTLLAALALGITLQAWACGPDFPENLLDHRGATLTHLPARGFAAEAARLVPAPPGAATAGSVGIGSHGDAEVRAGVERDWLGDQAELAQRVREADSGAAAWNLGAGLPVEARRYLAGAAAFAQGAHDEARQRFASVLELPAAERRHYGPWAQYMLGRLLADTVPAEAAAAFAQVRELVAAGADDPLGLALDSQGEQARQLLATGDTAGAVRLYAEQAARGSELGWTSLLVVAWRIVASDTELDAAAHDALSRKLVAAYLITRGDVGDLDDADAATLERVTQRFLAALGHEDAAGFDDASRLAALAYRSGRYDVAARLAAKGDDGLSAWVRAKLALRAGDIAAATQAYAVAAKAFPPTEPDGDGEGDAGVAPAVDYCRVRGEQGTLALARGEYLAAMDHLFHANAWEDAAFVAERVLTVEELEDFVAHNAAAPGSIGGFESGADPVHQLRTLLARRLLRAGQWDAALAHFDDPQLRAKAQEYVAARRAAEQGGRIERAEAWYRAAELARNDGMELLGYEVTPDMATWGGSFPTVYDFGYPRAGESASGVGDEPAFKLPFAAGPTDAERVRVTASAAQPDRRFHYRYVAAEFAARAADLVPQRSQAYAALLCSATGYVLNDAPELARDYWRRYVKHGPYVPWADDFGNQCLAPDFPGAAKRLHFERVRAAKRLARRALPWAAGALLLALGAGAWWWQRRRRGSAAQGHVVAG